MGDPDDGKKENGRLLGHRRDKLLFQAACSRRKKFGYPRVPAGTRKPCPRTAAVRSRPPPACWLTLGSQQGHRRAESAREGSFGPEPPGAFVIVIRPGRLVPIVRAHYGRATGHRRSAR